MWLQCGRFLFTEAHELKDLHLPPFAGGVVGVRCSLLGDTEVKRCLLNPLLMGEFPMVA